MAEISYTKEGMVIDGELIELEHIVEQCNSIKIKEDNLQLLTMCWKGWRGFDGCTEKIVKPKSKIDTILKYITGKTIYFGEIAGKHSDISNTLDEEDISVSSDPKVIQKFLSNNTSGHSYDHSFLYKFMEYVEEGYYDLTEEIIGELNEAIYN